MNRNLTVLIADDNEDDAFFLARTFRNLELQNPIQVVRDGEQVIQYLLGEGRFSDRVQFPFPSVIFLDLKMPGADGFVVLQWLRDHPDYDLMPSIVFTTSSPPSDVTRAYQLGANACLVKPVILSELTEMLKKIADFWSICVKPTLPQSAGGSEKQGCDGPPFSLRGLPRDKVVSCNQPWREGGSGVAE